MSLDMARHSAAHLMAAAVCRLFDDVKLDIGPSTEDGFYYDFDLPRRLTPDDFPAIEAEMKLLREADLPFERLELDRQEARRRLAGSGQTYKLQRLEDIPGGDPVTFYRCGDFEDLCRGPHLPSTGRIPVFKLVAVAGSYFRGLETNPMLQRVYGIVAESEEALAGQLQRIEQARQRDHRKLGRELNLFSIREDVGPGLVHWHPAGARVRVAIEDYWRREHLRNGYEMLFTPHLGRCQLWETSGHLGFYGENMFPRMEMDGTDYYVKPMNCPFHIQVYQDGLRSYRDLPLRWAELGTVYRYEKSGVLHGLLRVRGFTQDDAHIFCAPEQVEKEVADTVAFALRVLNRFGFTDVTAFLATRPDKSVGEPPDWQRATLSLENALRISGLDYRVDQGGGAFYGPKIDLKIRDAIGREWQLSTIQFDFNLPERFDLSFIGEDGKPHRPYMIHRALLGSLERFFGILIEHYAGAFPLWLAPEQVRIITVSEHQLAYAGEVAARLRESDFRVQIDTRPDKIGAKIRRAQADKVPVMAVAGNREAEAARISVRRHGAAESEVMSLDALIEALRRETQ